MADSYKILAQASAQDVVIYTVPVGFSASISSILINNYSGSSASYQLGVVLAADTATTGLSGAQYLVPTRAIADGVSDEIVGGVVLSAGDELRASSTSADVNIHVYGVEIV